MKPSRLAAMWIVTRGLPLSIVNTVNQTPRKRVEGTLRPYLCDQRGIEQRRKFFSFTDGPLLCVRSEETHDIHAVQSDTPAILLTDDDQDSMFHQVPPIKNIRP